MAAEPNPDEQRPGTTKRRGEREGGSLIVPTFRARLP